MTEKEKNILFAAEKIFAEKGFEGTSTREISKEAKVNISMISYYFGSKEKLFERIFEYRTSEGLIFLSEVKKRKDIDAWQKVEIMIETYTERVKNLKTFYHILQREQLSCTNSRIHQLMVKTKISFLELYTEICKEGRNDGVFKNEIAPDLLHATINGTLFTAVNSLPVFKIFYKEENYEQDFYQRLKNHLKEIFKNLLGYEEKK